MKAIEHISKNPDVFEPTTSRKPEGEGNFASALQKVWRGLDQDVKEADKAAEEFASGINTNIHEVMILTGKAELSFRLVSAVRNKVLEAYREIMRMQV